MKKSLVFVVAIICIISAVFLIAQSNLLSGISQSAYRQESSNPFEEPPELEKEINSIDDILEDLSSLGCRLINASMEDTKLESILTVKDYTEFRRLAYNTKLVFFMTGKGYYYSTEQGSGIEYGIYCFTLYQGFPIGFKKTFRTPTFTQTEELKIISCTWSNNLEYVDLKIKNTGTAKLTIVQVSVNGEFQKSLSTSVNPGEETTVRVDGSFKQGVRYLFEIITANGNRFSYIAVAPS